MPFLYFSAFLKSIQKEHLLVYSANLCSSNMHPCATVEMIKFWIGIFSYSFLNLINFLSDRAQNLYEFDTLNISVWIEF